MAAWRRAATIGKGSSATVSLAVLPDQKTLIAAKSAPLSSSSLLQREAAILRRLQGCPHVVAYLGHDITNEKSNSIFNIFLEFASRGSLADLLRARGPLPEPSVKVYVTSVLKGLNFVHSNGYVHCDIKPENVLVFADGNLKIADFGLAKEIGGVVDDKILVRGTPMYMSPESVVVSGEFEPGMDVWALGCMALEMMSGNPPWRDLGKCTSKWGLMLKIGYGEELPEIPAGVSEEARDFLGRCFVRDPEKRWTAEMLLNHPFVQNLDQEEVEDDDEWGSGSPRSMFGFGNVDDSPRSMFGFGNEVSGSRSILQSECCEVGGGVERRIGMLVTGEEPDWWSCSTLVDEGWICVRDGRGC